MKPRTVFSLTKLLLSALFVLSALGTAACLAASSYLVLTDSYDRSTAFSELPVCRRLANVAAGDVSVTLHSALTRPAEEGKRYLSETLGAQFDPQRTNLRVRVAAADGTLLFESEKAHAAEGRALLPLAELRKEYTTAQPPSLSAVIEIFLDPALPVYDTFAFFTQLHEWLFARRYALPVICFLLCAATALLYALLLSAAGRQKGEAEVTLGSLDRIPTDVLYLGALLLAALPCLLAVSAYRSTSTNPRFASALIAFTLVCLLCGAALLVLFLAVSVSTAARIKAGTWFSSMLCVRFVKLLVSAVRSVFTHFSAVWKVLLCAAVYALLARAAIVDRSWVSEPVFVLASLPLLFLICRGAIGFTRLSRAARALSQGDLTHRIELGGLSAGQRAMAVDLMRIGEGASRAVEARMKSERMKTDLITNVSHDLKTPLTSIISYVELLKKEPPENETAAGYIEVLDRQAQRLKKLTEDIVEASKASSGVLNVKLADVAVTELLRQCAAEYTERFEAAHLTPVLRLPEEPLTVRADGRLLWRIFDNLLGNVVKYALTGTRVYLDAVAVGGEALLSVRNVSREMLERSGEELMERFVRGDASRHAEGSGLGLSIAGSLAALQGGRLTIVPDGDLFRAELRLPLAPPPPPPPTAPTAP